jgi:hypothetical protein
LALARDAQHGVLARGPTFSSSAKIKIIPTLPSVWIESGSFVLKREGSTWGSAGTGGAAEEEGLAEA